MAREKLEPQARVQRLHGAEQPASNPLMLELRIHDEPADETGSLGDARPDGTHNGVVEHRLEEHMLVE